MTDDEIDTILAQAPHDDDGYNSHTFARAIIAAYQAKLIAGVKVPEPDTEEPASNYFGKPCYYTEETLQQYGDARDQAGYLRGLEDAKRVCETEFTVEGIAQRCAAAIDKLKGGE